MPLIECILFQDLGVYRLKGPPTGVSPAGPTCLAMSSYAIWRALVPCHGLGSGVLAMVQIPADPVSSSGRKTKSTSICYCIAIISYLMEGFSLVTLLLVSLNSRLFSQANIF